MAAGINKGIYSLEEEDLLKSGNPEKRFRLPASPILIAAGLHTPLRKGPSLSDIHYLPNNLIYPSII